MQSVRFLVMTSISLLLACTPKPPIKPSGDFVAINQRPETVGAYAARPSADHFEFTFLGDLQDGLKVLQKLQPQLLIRPTKGTPYPIRIEIDARNVTLNEALGQIKSQVGKEADFEFGTHRRKGRPFVRVRYFKK
jgi:hypothetical protein